MTQFHVLSATTLAGKVPLVPPPAAQPLERLLAEPALSAMTDLTRITAVTVRADEFVEAAHVRMLERRVRMLFAVDHSGDVVGLITSNDLLGEKPMQIVRERGVRHDEIRVQDIMTPADAVEALELADLHNARLGDVVETMRAHGRQHALVVRREGSAAPQICGVFSAADLSRRLGTPVVPMSVARTFAEIEETLANA